MGRKENNRKVKSNLRRTERMKIIGREVNLRKRIRLGKNICGRKKRRMWRMNVEKERNKNVKVDEERNKNAEEERNKNFKEEMKKIVEG